MDKKTSGQTTRRDFLKTTAAASALTAATLAVPRGVYAAGSDKMKIGLIGCGGRGTGAALDSMKATPRNQIVAMGDLFADQAVAARKRLAAEAGAGKEISAEQFAVTDDKVFSGFDAFKRVIDDGGIDMIVEAAPPGFRPHIFKYAVEKDKHVFFEKPCAVDPAGVRMVLAAAEEAQKKNLGVCSGTVFRHQTTHRDAIKQLHDGVIGDIVAGFSYYNVAGLWHKPRQPQWTDTEYQIRNWLYYTWLAGDHIVEQAIHRIDIQNWIMNGPPKSAYGMGGRQARTDIAYGHIYDHFTIEYVYEGKDGREVRVIHQCRQQDNTDARVTEYYVGTKGQMQPDKGPIQEKRVRPESLGDAYVREHADLAQSIVDGKPMNEGKQIAETTLTGIMGRMSAYTGKLVTWEQAMSSTLDLWPKNTLAFGPMEVPPVAIPGKDPLV
ncbi:MAG: Gfo/Idh/MocA family oxidoreductase [Tepidisphaeraceae bacterium]